MGVATHGGWELAGAWVPRVDKDDAEADAAFASIAAAMHVLTTSYALGGRHSGVDSVIGAADAEATTGGSTTAAAVAAVAVEARDRGGAIDLDADTATPMSRPPPVPSALPAVPPILLLLLDAVATGETRGTAPVPPPALADGVDTSARATAKAAVASLRDDTAAAAASGRDADGDATTSDAAPPPLPAAGCGDGARGGGRLGGVGGGSGVVARRWA